MAVARGAVHRWHLGTVLLGHGPGLVADRRRPVGDGALIDHVVHSHARGAELRTDAVRGTTVYALERT
jgi:hypothetical protein